RLTNDKRTRSSDIHDAILAQSPCEDAWAKRPVPANVDAANENDKSHSQEETSTPCLAVIRIRLRGPLPQGERWHRVLRTLARSEPRTPSGSFVAPGHPKPPRDALCSRLGPQQQRFGCQQNYLHSLRQPILQGDGSRQS